MNIVEMQYQFGIQMNQFSDPLKLHSDDILYWLNKSQLDIVKSRYAGDTTLGFEQSQERIDDLRVLMQPNVELNTSYTGSARFKDFHIEEVTLPNDYMFLINQRSKLIIAYPDVITYAVADNKRTATNTTVHERTTYNRYGHSDHLFSMLSDPFNTTTSLSPLAAIRQNKLYVYTDKYFIVDKVYIDYLRLPVEMSLDPQQSCELPEHLHKDVIDRAVTLFLNNTRELKQRLQRETPVTDTTSIEEQ